MSVIAGHYGTGARTLAYCCAYSDLWPGVLFEGAGGSSASDWRARRRTPPLAEASRYPVPCLATPRLAMSRHAKPRIGYTEKRPSREPVRAAASRVPRPGDRIGKVRPRRGRHARALAGLGPPRSPPESFPGVGRDTPTVAPEDTHGVEADQLRQLLHGGLVGTGLEG